MPRTPRTSSSTTILLTAAAAAVTAATASGCVSVRPPAAPKAPTPTVSAPAPRPEGHADRPVVEAPAREALERTKPTAPHRTPARHAEQPRRTADPAPPHSAPKVAPAPRRTTVPEPRTTPKNRRAEKLPKAPAQTDVCALGRRYGGWDRDSPQSAICRDTYGR
ncbi:hypothetical protein ACFV9W_33795 [Streptomyces sp. NPDC059897]|uniref:hypothetical protein n=1 Tax=Streptomyces sp. NPDC059897 TaxID=3346994 RepID=UPI003652C72F